MSCQKWFSTLCVTSVAIASATILPATSQTLPSAVPNQVERSPFLTASFSCLPEPIESSPRAVRVVTRRQIEQQAIRSRNLAGVVGSLVPGVSSPAFSRQGLTLRGRRVGVLIDGVPLAPGSAATTGINLSNIERIEVIPTPTPLCRA